MRITQVVLYLLLTVMFSGVRQISAEELKVLVLDALDGKPEPNTKVEYFCVGPPRNSTIAWSTTNTDGFAKISPSCNDEQKIQIEVFPPKRKDQCGGDASLNVQDTVSMGFISDPSAGGGIGETRCPSKISKSLKPVPGQVTIFVKKPTWWQSHVAG